MISYGTGPSYFGNMFARMADTIKHEFRTLNCHPIPTQASQALCKNNHDFSITFFFHDHVCAQIVHDSMISCSMTCP